MHSIRPALPTDVEQIASCVTAAYEHYVNRIGKPPGPMLDDYTLVLAEHLVWVVEDAAQIVGLLVLIEETDSILLDNIAIHSTHQGKGLGRQLMALAEREAHARGYAEILLYTHVKMTENIAIYAKLGYVETARRTVRGYERVYMKKSLN